MAKEELKDRKGLRRKLKKIFNTSVSEARKREPNIRGKKTGGGNE